MNKALQSAINKAAHAAAQEHYRETRARLITEAEAMLADGLPIDLVIDSLCAHPCVLAREAPTQS